MPATPKRRVRPTPTIMMLALADVAGVLALALGAGYLAHGRGFFFDSVPASTTEALVLTLGGLALILVAAVKMLAEVLKQMPQDPPAA